MELKKRIVPITIVFALAIIVATAVLTDTWPGNGFCLMAGLIGMLAGIGYLLIGLLLLFFKNKWYAYRFFISAVVLGVPGFIVFNFFPNY